MIKYNKFENNKDTTTSFYGIQGCKWMVIVFIPWTIAWILGGINPIFRTLIPFLMSLVIAILKKKVKALTYFESSTLIYFLTISILSYFKILDLKDMSSYLNNIGLGLIWVGSLIYKKSLTAEYSIYDQKKDLSKNDLFNKTNEILTLFWGVIFLFQGIIGYFLHLKNLDILTIISSILPIILAVKFTSFFSKWYPEFIIENSKNSNKII